MGRENRASGWANVDGKKHLQQVESRRCELVACSVSIICSNVLTWKNLAEAVQPHIYFARYWFKSKAAPVLAHVARTVVADVEDTASLLGMKINHQD